MGTEDLGDTRDYWAMRLFDRNYLDCTDTERETVDQQVDQEQAAENDTGWFYDTLAMVQAIQEERQRAPHPAGPDTENEANR